MVKWENPLWIHIQNLTLLTQGVYVVNAISNNASKLQMQRTKTLNNCCYSVQHHNCRNINELGRDGTVWISLFVKCLNASFLWDVILSLQAADRFAKSQTTILLNRDRRRYCSCVHFQPLTNIRYSDNLIPSERDFSQMTLHVPVAEDSKLTDFILAMTWSWAWT